MKALTSVVISVGKSKKLCSLLMFANNDFFLITSPGTFPLNYFFFFSGNTVTKNFVHGRNENSIFFYQKTPEYFALEIE